MKKTLIYSLLFLISYPFFETDFMKNNDKDEWIFSFKAAAFRSCLTEVGVTFQHDASGSINMSTIGPVYLKSADSIGKQFADTIRLRAKWLPKDLEGTELKINGSLLFFQSKRLDSLSLVYYEKYQNE